MLPGRTIRPLPPGQEGITLHETISPRLARRLEAATGNRGMHLLPIGRLHALRVRYRMALAAGAVPESYGADVLAELEAALAARGSAA